MNDFLTLCEHRQSCRDFASQPVEHEKIVKILEAARLTPSGCNSQPWNFVVVEDPQKVSQVAKATQQLGANVYMDGAKAFIVILEEHAVLMPRIRPIFDSQVFAKNDLGAAAVTICYAAQDLGLGTCILGLFDREKLCEILDIPIEKQFATVIAIGYPADNTVRPKIRKPLDEIVRFV